MLEFQRGRHAGKSRHQADHLPGAETGARGPGCAAAHESIVLVQPARRVWSGANVQRCMADCRPQDVDRVQRRDRLALNSHDMLGRGCISGAEVHRLRCLNEGRPFDKAVEPKLKSGCEFLVHRTESRR